LGSALHSSFAYCSPLLLAMIGYTWWRTWHVGGKPQFNFVWCLLWN